MTGVDISLSPPARGGHGALLHPDATTTYRLWAPRASAVHLVRDGVRTAMARADVVEGGWWVLHHDGRAGERYGYSLDGGPVRPDPAARALPDGVHEPGALVDPSAFAWPAAEAAWVPPTWEAAAVYELHVGAFTPEGTLDAAIPHLDELAALGITHVELMPLNGVNGVHNWGYDGVAWWAVHQPYGGPEALVRFVTAAHARGLAVLLDVVHNHLGPSGNYLPEFGPYLDQGRASTWGANLNLDGPDSDPVRRFIIANAVSWLADYHLDGLRLDAVHALVDVSATHVLTDLAAAVDDLGQRSGRPRVLIAETDRNDPRTVAPRVVGGHGMTAQWADELHHAVHVAITGEREGYYADYGGLPDVAEAWRRGFVHDGSRWSPSRRRLVGAPLGDVDGRALVGCLQNHDQIGNRASGDRLCASVDPDLVRLGAVLVACAPHTPMLFMGEEWGATMPFRFFTSHPEPELGEAVQRGRAEEFADFTAFGGEVPDPQDPATFAASVLDRSEADSDSGRAWRTLWGRLLELRRAEPALGGGRRDLVAPRLVRDDALVLHRDHPDSAAVLVAAVTGDEAVEIAEPGAWVLALCTADPDLGGPGTDVDPLTCPPRTARVWIAQVT